MSRSINILLILVAVVLFSHGTIAQAVTIDWATIGDTGNANDIHGAGFGGVDYKYRISKHEVSNAQYVEFLNDVAATDPYGLSRTGSNVVGYIRSGTSGSYTYSVKPDEYFPQGGWYAFADKPVVLVTWYNAIRYANWLTSGDTENGTYTITNGGFSSGTVTLPDHSTLGAGKVFLPTEDEWHKAAYYDGVNNIYYDYPTSTDVVPNNNLPSSDTGNSANFFDSNALPVDEYTTSNAQYPLTDVGAYTLSSSPYGTFDQGGNVIEWCEKLVISQSRRQRGGSWARGHDDMAASSQAKNSQSGANSLMGFRIASSAIPEPSTYTLAALGMLGLGFYGWRRKQG